MQLSGVTDQSAVRKGDRCAPPRMEGHHVGRAAEHDRHRERVGDRAHEARTSLTSAGRPSPPSGTVAVAREQDGQVSRLARHGAMDRREHLGRRLDPDVLRGSARLLTVARHDQADLEEADVLGAPGDIAHEGIDHRRQDADPHERRLVGQRVGECHGAGARLVGGPSQGGVARIADKGSTPDLGETGTASTSATRRRTCCPWVRPRPPGGVGTTDGMRS